MLLLSIVIPVYNVQDYLLPCLESVFAECVDFSYEVLLVDDGSTDGSGELCDKIASQKPSCVKVFHKINGGLSDARNFGVLRATGAYVFYLDSDDYLVEGGIRAMVAAALQSKSDVVCANFYYQYNNRKALFDVESRGILVYNGGEEALAALIEGKRYQNFAWGKLIRRELAQQFLFPKGKLFEDTYWFHLILHYANKVVVVSEPVVYYVQREGSISFDYKLKSLDILDGYTERLHFFERNYPRLVDKQKLLIAHNCINQAWMICRYLNKKDRTKAIKKIRDTISCSNLIENNLLEISEKRKLLLIMKSLRCYKWYYVGAKVIEKICR